MKNLTDQLKRIIDCALAAVCLIVFSPLFLYCYIAIKREDGGPVIYKQARIGYHGKPFYIYKFRSMHTDAEEDGYHLFTGDEDERLTRIGKKLRDHHLDELPQLWNVLIGDMAFIGPRPERPYYIRQIMEIDPRYEQLYKIRPALLHTPRSTMAIRTRWRRCSAAGTRSLLLGAPLFAHGFPNSLQDFH